MAKSITIGNKKIEFPEEIKETIYFENVVCVVYRKDKEISNNVDFLI